VSFPPQRLTHLVVGDDQHTKIWAKGMRNSAATISADGEC
jgi:hypothetical protein